MIDERSEPRRMNQSQEGLISRAIVPATARRQPHMEVAAVNAHSPRGPRRHRRNRARPFLVAAALSSLACSFGLMAGSAAVASAAPSAPSAATVRTSVAAPADNQVPGYTPTGNSPYINGVLKTPQEMADDCENPITVVSASPHYIAEAAYPQCAISVVGHSSFAGSLSLGPDSSTVTMNGKVDEPLTASCVQGVTASTTISTEVSTETGLSFGGFAFFEGAEGALISGITAALAPEFSFSTSSSYSYSEDHGVSVSFDDLGWLGVSQPVGVAELNITARYTNGLDGNFSIYGVVPDTTGTPTFIGNGRVLSDDEYMLNCQNQGTGSAWENYVAGLPEIPVQNTSSGWYPSNGRLVNISANDACLDDTGWSTSPGQQMQIYACGTGSTGLDQQANQTWTWTWQGASNGWIIKNDYSGMCLDGDYNSANLPIAVQNPCDGRSGEVWAIDEYQGLVYPDQESTEIFTLRNPFLGNVCIDPPQATNNTPLILGSCSAPPFTGNSATSVLKSIGGATESSAPGGATTGALMNEGSGNCLDDTNWSKTPLAVQMQIWTCTGGSNQQWTLNTSNGQLKNGYAGLCLEVKGGSSSPGTPAVIDTCGSSSSQVMKMVWTSFSNAPKGYEIINSNGLCLDNSGNNPSSGNHVQWYTCNKTGAQDWYLE